MAHKLEKFYSSFGGVDTRSNKLLMDPRTFRNGSKNFRYNFQDEIQNANGFQHKTAETPVSFVDVFEYNFRDVNTGQAKSQLLAVGVDGNLYRRLQNTLVWSDVGSATSYSFYYDEVSDSFKFDLNGVGSVTVTETTTLNQLITALNAFPAVLVEVQDDSGVAVTSSYLAYLLDVRIEDAFTANSSWSWEVVPHPNIASTTGTNGNLSTYSVIKTPFETTVKAQDPGNYPDVAASYEGISAENLNNSIYITDGGFVHKYDGKTVFRAGMPKQRNQFGSDFGTTLSTETLTGMTYTPVAAASVGLTALSSSIYNYKARFGFIDYSGFAIYGHMEDIQGPIAAGPVAPNNVIKIDTKGIYYGQDFPTFCAKVNGTQATGVSGAGITLTVHTGHNILPGMVVRQVTNNGAGSVTRSTSNSFVSFLAKVTAVTETTITLAETACSDLGDLSYASNFRDGQILQAYFVESTRENKIVSDYYPPTGAFIEIYRTKSAAPTGPDYLLTILPVPHKQGDIATIYDDQPDASLTENLVDAQPGNELPRACKYLTAWQEVLVQGGYPADGTLKNERYPSASNPGSTTRYCQDVYNEDAFYTEALLCDFQSVYWADLLSPEGFPQDGLNEFLVKTKQNDKIKGIAPNKDALFALKERSTGVLTGDLGTNDVILEELEDDIGLASHKTIQDAKGSLIWLDANKGFYSCVAGRLPVNIGYPICDYQQINSQGLNYSLACSANSRTMDMYFCCVGGTWFIYDYSKTSQQGSYRNCWYIWDRFQVTSAVYTADKELVFYGSDIIWKIKTTDTRWDFTDHTSAIEMDARTAWINFGAPTIDKRWERFWVNSIQGGFTLIIDQYGNYLEPLLGSNSITFKEGTKLTVKDWIKATIDKLSAVSVGFRNSEKNKFVRIQGFEIEYAPDYDASEPKR